MPTLNTRIKLKYDTLANWSTANPVLLAGEVAVVAIPTESESTVGQVTKPAIVFKVGDGTTEFNTLPYASGLAADVYAWAKAATKPSYTAGEVGADAAGTAAGLIGGLDVTDSAVGGQYVSAVSQVDGKIQVTRASLPTVTIPEYTLQAGDEEGTIELLKDGAVVGTAVEVTGWTELVAEVAAKYVKPAGGIPKTDLASDVQTSLGKADTAVQSGDLGALATKDTIVEADITGTISTSKISGLGALATANTVTQSQVEGLSAALAGKADTTTVDGINGRLTTAEGEIDTLQGQIGGLTGAMHFKGVLEELPGDLSSYNAGDVIVVGKVEYVCVDNEGEKSWYELGDEGSYLTKTEASSAYVPQTRTVNGKALSANISLAASDVGADPAGTAAGLIAGLDVAAITVGANQTLASISEADGIIAATPVAIAIDAGQVTSGTFADARIPALEIAKINGLQDALDDKLESADIANLATKEEVNAKQDALSGAQLNAVNSGITAAKVATYDGYAANISALEAKPGLDKVGTVTSVAGANGIKITGTATTTPVVEIDTAAVFIFDCGTATTNID